MHYLQESAFEIRSINVLNKLIKVRTKNVFVTKEILSVKELREGLQPFDKLRIDSKPGRKARPNLKNHERKLESKIKTRLKPFESLLQHLRFSLLV